MYEMHRTNAVMCSWSLMGCSATGNRLVGVSGLRSRDQRKGYLWASDNIR